MIVHIGNNIECIRVAKRIKQQVMAKGLGITQQRWSQLVQQRKWSSELLHKVSTLYEMTPEEIMEYDPENTIVAKGTHHHFTFFTVNLNIHGADETTFDKIGNLMNLFSELNKNKK
jgi:DNA-binding Xre family transcriptional regulator